MNWSALAAIGAFCSFAAVIISAAVSHGALTQRIEGHENRLDEHDDQLEQHGQTLTEHSVKLAESVAWRRGFETGRKQS